MIPIEFQQFIETADAESLRAVRDAIIARLRDAYPQNRLSLSMVCELLAQGLTVPRIAEKCGVSKAAAYKFCRVHGLDFPRPKKPKKENPQKLCDTCGKPHERASNYCCQECRPLALHAKAKLTMGQAKEVHRLREAGMKYQDLSKKFGVSIGAIQQILKGETYPGSKPKSGK